MSYELLWEAKKALEPLLKEAQMKGSTCWGPKSKNNIHSGPNLVFRIGDEMVTVSQPGNGLKMQEFRKTTNTKLGQRVREYLRRMTAFKEKEILSVSGNTWCCTSCGRRGEFDPGLLAEVDSRGEGARDLVRKIIREHAAASPFCSTPRIEVLDKNLVKQEELARLLALERVK